MKDSAIVRLWPFFRDILLPKGSIGTNRRGGRAHGPMNHLGGHAGPPLRSGSGILYYASHLDDLRTGLNGYGDCGFGRNVAITVCQPIGYRMIDILEGYPVARQLDVGAVG